MARLDEGVGHTGHCLGAFLFRRPRVFVCVQRAGVLPYLGLPPQELTRLAYLPEALLLATVGPYGDPERGYASGGVATLHGQWHGVRHLVALVLRVAPAGASMVYGAMLVFLFADGDADGHAAAA